MDDSMCLPFCRRDPRRRWVQDWQSRRRRKEEVQLISRSEKKSISAVCLCGPRSDYLVRRGWLVAQSGDLGLTLRAASMQWTNHVELWSVYVFVLYSRPGWQSTTSIPLTCSFIDWTDSRIAQWVLRILYGMRISWTVFTTISTIIQATGHPVYIFNTQHTSTRNAKLMLR